MVRRSEPPFDAPEIGEAGGDAFKRQSKLESDGHGGQRSTDCGSPYVQVSGPSGIPSRSLRRCLRQCQPDDRADRAWLGTTAVAVMSARRARMRSRRSSGSTAARLTSSAHATPRRNGTLLAKNDESLLQVLEAACFQMFVTMLVITATWKQFQKRSTFRPLRHHQLTSPSSRCRRTLQPAVITAADPARSSPAQSRVAPRAAGDGHAEPQPHNSASISARGMTGTCRRAASRTSGLDDRTAADTTTTSASPTLAASCV